MSPLKSSLARSATKIFGVFRDRDLSLRGREDSSKYFDASTDWIRILNQAGPSSGALSFGGVAYDELLVFGVGGGAGGAAGSDDDGGGGGAGGAGQFSGYRITGINPANPYPYTIPGGGAPVTPSGTDGNPGGDTTINDPTGVIFSLTGGAGAPQGPTNGNAGLAPATAQPPYGSHGGGGGGIQVARDNNPDLRPTDGTPGAYGGAGGGGGGAWLGDPTHGSAGRNNTLSTQTVSSYNGVQLDVTFTAVGTNGTAGSAPTNNGPSPGPGDANPNNPAGGSGGTEYAGGGGAGGGTRFFGTGNGGYGAGGGGGGGQNPKKASGVGGAGYLVVYARIA